MKRNSLTFHCLSFFFAVVCLGGCSQFKELPSGTVKEFWVSPVVEQQPVSVSTPVQGEEASRFEYRVGPGDVLSIDMPGLVERPAGAAERERGFRVHSSGKIILPLVGGVTVAGLTVDEIHARLVEISRSYIKNPVVTVEVIEFKSQPVYLLGKFNQPGVRYLDRPTNLIQGITLGGGLQDSANLRGARLIRDEKTVPVDIYDLLYKNDLRQNIPLQPGDTVYIPGNEQQNVFVFGKVDKQGPISMINGRLSLMQALSTAGLGNGGYDHEHVRIIRSYSPTRGELLVLNLGQIMHGDTMPFPLMDGDIIYVPRTGIGDWNQALSDILPTLQAFSAVLQPFVQIKYLTQD